MMLTWPGCGRVAHVLTRHLPRLARGSDAPRRWGRVRGRLTTVFGVLESSLQYEDFGIIKKRIGVDFGKTRGSTVAILD